MEFMEVRPHQRYERLSRRPRSATATSQGRVLVAWLPGPGGAQRKAAGSWCRVRRDGYPSQSGLNPMVDL